MSKVKERPILFSGPYVRAILEGRKSQTRRAVSAHLLDGGYSFDRIEIDSDSTIAIFRDHFLVQDVFVRCPYGKPGDRLWVRETWLPDAPRDGSWADVEFFGCKGAPLLLIPERFQQPEHCLYRASWGGGDLVWKPSIHMPRWASRILLEVTAVRVERLQDISDADALAEGCSSSEMRHGDRLASVYARFWESTNGPGSWDANLFVWVIEFRRVESEAAR